jgi:hypothetical protein
MDQDSEDHADDDSAFASGMQILNAYPDPKHPAKRFDFDSIHLSSPTLLLALDQFSPTPESRRNIEFEIDNAVNGAQDTNSKAGRTDVTGKRFQYPVPSLSFGIMYKVRVQGGMTQDPTSHPSRHEDELTSTEIADIRHRLDRRRLVSLCLELPLNIVLRHSVNAGLHVQSRNSSMNQRRTMIPKTRIILGHNFMGMASL